MKVYSPDGGSMEADARCLSILLEAGFTKTKPEKKEEVVEEVAEPVAVKIESVAETTKAAPSKKLPAKSKKIRKKT